MKFGRWILLKCGRPHIGRRRLILMLVFALSVLLLFYGVRWLSSSRKPTCSLNEGKNGNDSKERFESWTPSRGVPFCKFPRLDPVSDEIKSLIGDPPPLVCSASINHTLRFRTTYGNKILPVLQEKITLEEGEICCYKTVARDGGGPNGTSNVSEECFPVSLEVATDVPADHEFVYLQCSLPNTAITHEDMFAFVHLKKPNKVTGKIEKNDGRPMMNILILGLDAQSRMNFLRTMPLSNAFLLQNLSAIPLKGYTKVGDNSLPNLVPLLTGLSLDELEKTCWPRNAPFDECPFIWKDFSEEGYLTSYSEDAVWMGLFNYHMKGFLQPPTDYYLHHLMKLMDRKIGHKYVGNSNLCYGPRLGFEVLLDHAVKTAVTLGKNGDPYFQFVWVNSLFHDYINYPKLGDKLLLHTLKYLLEYGYLDNTLLIVLGDHGMRMGPFRLTSQGKIEERMPLAYFAFPPWFRERYGKEMAFLKENGENRLTTHFDTYATLLHVLELEAGRPEKEGHLSVTERGVSLLKNISKCRTCLEAGVDESNCVCNYVITPLPMKNTDALSASAFVVKYINSLLEERDPMRKCASLMLDKITEVVTKEIRDSISTPKKFLQITLVTLPGSAVFEATLRLSRAYFFFTRWEISGDIKRLDSYRAQSKCIDEDTQAKKYCFCNNKLEIK